MKTTMLRRRVALPLSLLVGATSLLIVNPDPAAGGAGMAMPFAVPGTPSPSPGAGSPSPGSSPGSDAGPGDEGESPMLRTVLDGAGRRYVEAQERLKASKKRQSELATELKRAEQRMAELTAEVNAMAAEAYRTGRMGPVTVLLKSSSADAFLERAQAMELMTMRDDQRLRDFNEARRAATEAKAAIDMEVHEQTRQLSIITKQKTAAEHALAEVGGQSTGGYVSATSPVAKAAPRSADGSWPAQSCSVNDPTTSGCITPRTLNALKEAQRAGFKRYVSCYRPGGPYEHPKGRACDFSSEKNSFGGVAKGEDRIYGNNLAAFFVRNADRLGILYVIWFKQIWFPATGWRAYRSGQGDPSSDHTNHVHLSML